jgi:hypothetical protein
MVAAQSTTRVTERSALCRHGAPCRRQRATPSGPSDGLGFGADALAVVLAALALVIATVAAVSVGDDDASTVGGTSDAGSAGTPRPG